ncbi:hypothetical protein C8R43DRAFT_132200 [Mycena crocata]|nr:hypothetical protein C8R43DRAFT_132200 [Mycena crocata]
MSFPCLSRYHRRLCFHISPYDVQLPAFAMPAARDSDARPEKKRKKPPACDQCKARRVLCHPQPINTPCPRCAEKGVKCTTTPVVRGRPPKRTRRTDSSSVDRRAKTADPPEAVASTSDTEPGEYKLTVTRCSPDVSLSLDLTPDLVSHLFESFSYLPQTSHPALGSAALRKQLLAVAWNIDLLPPEQRVLASCIMALSATSSFHRSIIGPGPQPLSFSDRTVFFRGADLRDYGIRRNPMCHALHARAYRLACEFGAMVKVSEDNTMSCFILGILDGKNEESTRPWATAYMAHVRAMAPTWNFSDPTSGTLEALWSGFLMIECLAATALRKPILLTRNDQLLMLSAEPPSLDALIGSVRATVQMQKPSASYVVFTIMTPDMYHVVRLTRELSETITGDYPRRNALNEAAVLRFLDELSALQALHALVFAQIAAYLTPQCHSTSTSTSHFNPPSTNSHPRKAAADSNPPHTFQTRSRSDTHRSEIHLPPLPYFDPPTTTPSTERALGTNVRACAMSMTMGYSGLVLALHRELEARSGNGNGNGASDLPARDNAHSTANHHDFPPGAVALPTQAQVNARSGGGRSGGMRMSGLQQRDLDLDLMQVHTPHALALYAPGRDRVRRQVRALAWHAAAEVARTLVYLPSLTHLTHLPWDALLGWAQFCVDEAEAEAKRGFVMDGERMGVCEGIMNALKLIGYSWDIPRSSALITRMEACLAAQHSPPSASFIPSPPSVPSSTASYEPPLQSQPQFEPHFVPSVPTSSSFVQSTLDLRQQLFLRFRDTVCVCPVCAARLCAFTRTRTRTRTRLFGTHPRWCPFWRRHVPPRQ